MVSVIRARRRSAVLTPSSLACLSVLPTINLTAGCLHDCAYCYIRGYANYPGEGRIVVYEDTLTRMREELRHRQKPHAVYFSPSSDLFQPAPEVLDLSHAVLEFLFGQGIGVAFLTKGAIPPDTLRLIIDHAELVRAQIGLVTLDEDLAAAVEPHAARPAQRLDQLAALIEGGVAAEARLDPILPTVTDTAASFDGHFAALARAGVKSAAAGILFLRPALVRSITRSIPDPGIARAVLAPYRRPERALMRGSPYPIHSAPAETRSAIFSRVSEAAAAHGIEINVCACKNADIASGTCNIAGTWRRRPAEASQAALVRA